MRDDVLGKPCGTLQYKWWAASRAWSFLVFVWLCVYGCLLFVMILEWGPCGLCILGYTWFWVCSISCSVRVCLRVKVASGLDGFWLVWVYVYPLRCCWWDQIPRRYGLGAFSVILCLLPMGWILGLRPWVWLPRDVWNDVMSCLIHCNISL